MTVATIISKTDLARRTRQIVNQARRGGAVIVESYGEEQVAILDAADYRCLRAWPPTMPCRRSRHRPPITRLPRAASMRTKCGALSSPLKGIHRRPGIAC